MAPGVRILVSERHPQCPRVAEIIGRTERELRAQAALVHADYVALTGETWMSSNGARGLPSGRHSRGGNSGRYLVGEALRCVPVRP